jgi:hypothetical protein
MEKINTKDDERKERKFIINFHGIKSQEELEGRRKKFFIDFLEDKFTFKVSDTPHTLDINKKCIDLDRISDNNGFRKLIETQNELSLKKEFFFDLEPAESKTLLNEFSFFLTVGFLSLHPKLMRNLVVILQYYGLKTLMRELLQSDNRVIIICLILLGTPENLIYNNLKGYMESEFNRQEEKKIEKFIKVLTPKIDPMVREVKENVFSSYILYFITKYQKKSYTTSNNIKELVTATISPILQYTDDSEKIVKFLFEAFKLAELNKKEMWESIENLEKFLSNRKDFISIAMKFLKELDGEYLPLKEKHKREQMELFKLKIKSAALKNIQDFPVYKLEGNHQVISRINPTQNQNHVKIYFVKIINF